VKLKSFVDIDDSKIVDDKDDIAVEMLMTKTMTRMFMIIA